MEKNKEISPYEASREQAEAWVEAAKEAYKLHAKEEWNNSRRSSHWRANWLRDRGIDQFGRDWRPSDGRPKGMNWFKWMWVYRNSGSIMLITIIILAIMFFARQ